MSDTEWQAWRSNWKDSGGTLPDVRERARQAASRNRRATLLFFALIVGGLIADVRALMFESLDAITCVGLIVWGVALSIGVVWIQRGSWLRKTANPREALAFLEQRVRIERHGALLFR